MNFLQVFGHVIWLIYGLKAMGHAGHVTNYVPIQPCEITCFVYNMSQSKFGKCFRR